MLALGMEYIFPIRKSAPIIRQRNAPSRRRRDGLISFARDETSQNGEDGIIERLFQALSLDPSQERYCLDVGAWDGVHLSNTHSLLVPSSKESSWGHWQGVLIEADCQRFEQLKELHEPLGNTCINVAVSCLENAPDGLVTLLKSTSIPKAIDFLCIDVDGSDYWLLHDIFLSDYQPKVICVEFNPTMPDDLIYIPSRSDVVRHGASLSALYELAANHNYVLVETTLYNAFFVPQKLYQLNLVREVPETTIEALHETTMGTSIYQLYDGTIKLHGCKKLLWHRVAMDEKKFQLLPPERRYFPFAPPPATSSNDKALHDLAVDMKAYCVNGAVSDDSSKKACAEALWEQLKEHGFALVRGTGIKRQQCQDAIHATNSFLQDADESVRKSCLTKDRARRGYSPMCTENFASLVGEQGPNDLVRKFRMGPVLSETDAESPLLRRNVWPSEESWSMEESSFFRLSTESYYETSCTAAHSIVRAICDGVTTHQTGLAESVKVLSMKESHTSILTLLGYRTGTRHKRKQKNPLVAPHTDVGVITMVLFDDGDCAMLQRMQQEQALDHSWIDVPLPSLVSDDPVFVVNIGDCLSELSDGTLPSTLHQVVPLKGSVPRNSLALFVGLDPNETLVLPSGKSMTYEEWRRRRIARALNVLKIGNESPAKY